MANRQNVKAQSMLITLILLLGIRMVTPCKFVDLIEPDDEGRGWRVKVDPAEEFLDTYEFRWAMMHNKSHEGRKCYLLQPYYSKDLTKLGILNDYVHNRMLCGLVKIVKWFL